MSEKWKRHLVQFAIVWGWTTVLYTIYQITNRYHLIAPQTLPVTALDRLIPFWPWTVVPYFVLIGGMYLPAFVGDRSFFRRTMTALTVGVLINYTIFALWPTTIIRPPAPAGPTFYEAWYRWLTIIDTPANCFPSGHITAPAIGCWALARENPQRRWLIAILFVPFALTILTTKQHYVWDLFGGLGTAAIGIFATRTMRKCPL
jgi:hypothetical protein